MSEGTAVLNPGKAEDVGISSARLERALALIEHWTNAGMTPGAALLVARRGTVVVHQGFGHFVPLGGINREPRAVQPDTIFLIASLTKPIVVAVASLLIERGLLLLDDRASSLIPEFSGEDRQDVRVRHLMTHTSGLPDMLPENTELRRQHALLSKFIECTYTTPLKFAAGSDVLYQSMGIALLGAIVERTSGVCLREMLHREFFRPLDMANTYLGLDNLQRERISQVTLPETEAQHNWNWNSDYWRDFGAPWGGMHATVKDYGVFLQLLLDKGRFGNRQILSGPMVQTMLTNQIADMPFISQDVKAEQAWGLGWRLNQPRGAHHMAELASPRTFGHMGATGTTAWADPDSGLICVLFTNQPKSGRLLSLLSNVVAASLVE